MRRLVILIGVLGLLAAQAASAISDGQKDEFSGSVNGWQRGSAVLGGPDGASDGYLLLSADGSSANGKLVTFNQAQWAGDYVATSIGAILLFARNPGATDLQIRLALGDAQAPAVGGTWYATNVSVFLPAGSGWVPVIFHLGSGDLTRVTGTAAYADVMKNVVTLRVLHSLAPSAFGDNVVATLGVDKIVALPEPATTPTLLCGIALLASCGALHPRRRRAKA